MSTAPQALASTFALRRRALLVLACVGAFGLAACKPSSRPAYQGEGRLVAAGPAREVLAAPGGGALAWLAEPTLASDRGHNTSNQVYLGIATFSAFGPPVTLGRGVATVPGSFFFSPSGAQVGALTQWSFQGQTGVLVVGDVNHSKARTVARDVSFFAFSRDGETLGYVAESALWIGPADGSAPAAKVANDVSTFEFAPDGSSLVARSRSLMGGKLSLVEPGSGRLPTDLGEGTAEYAWSPDGSRIAFTSRNAAGGYDLFVLKPGQRPEKIGSGVPTFRFSFDGKHLAYIGDVSFKKQFGDLFLLPGGSKTSVKLGETVIDFAFSPSSERIAWLDKYNAQNRGGTLTWAQVGPKPEPHDFGPDVPSFIWSPDSEHLAYAKRQLTPVFSIDLFLAEAGGENETQQVGQGVFGYAFDTDSERLFMRTRCTRNGRACDLRSIPVAKPDEASTLVARAIHTFEPATEDGDLLLITYARTDADALDIAVVPSDGSQEPRMLDQRVLAGTQIVRRGKESGVAYAVLDPNRLGVYLAEFD